MRFQTKLSILFTTILMLQSILIACTVNHYATNLIMHNKEKDMNSIVNLVDSNITIRVQSINKVVKNVTEDDWIQELVAKKYVTEKQKKRITQYLLNINDMLGGGNEFFILKKYGSTFDDLYFLKEKLDMQEEVLNLVEKSVEHTDWINWSGVEEKGCIFVSSAICHENQIQGILILKLDTSIFASSLLYNKNDFEKEYTFLVDSNGELICSNKGIDKKWVNKINERFQEGNRRFYTKREGQQYYISGQYNGLTGWTIYTVLATRYIFVGNKELEQFLASVVVLGGIGAVILILVFSYSLTKPLQLLSKSMKRVEKGDFSIRIPIKKRQDEIGELMDTFNFMTDEIERLIKEVYKERLAQKEAELTALEAQINPHFLYNTLDSINWILIDKGEYELSEVIISLGGLMRYCIQKGERFVPLSKERQYVVDYFTIQKVRLEERLQYEIQVEEEVEEFIVPKLILQPLVENAIKHGIEPKREGGMISIIAKQEVKQGEKLLVIMIEDDGAGIEAERLKILQEKLLEESLESIGISNVERRIKLYYGEQYGMKIQSREGKGTKIKLEIPQKRKG